MNTISILSRIAVIFCSLLTPVQVVSSRGFRTDIPRHVREVGRDEAQYRRMRLIEAQRVVSEHLAIMDLREG